MGACSGPGKSMQSRRLRQEEKIKGKRKDFVSAAVDDCTHVQVQVTRLPTELHDWRMQRKEVRKRGGGLSWKREIKLSLQVRN